MKLVHVFSAPQSAYFFMTGQLDFMQSQGVDVTVIMPLDSVFNPKFREKHPNVKVININLVRNISIVKDIVSLWNLLKFFSRIKPDIIHLHTPKASLLGALAGRILFIRNIIYQMHGLVSVEGNNVRRGLMYQIEKFTCSLATKIFAVSNSLKEFAVENNYCGIEKISVIQNGTINGIDYLNKFNPNVIAKSIETLNQKAFNKFVVGFVGRLVDDKGIKDYIEVLARLKMYKIPVLGVIIGPDESGEDFEYLMKKNKNIYNDIIVLGPQMEPQRFMIYFDVLLLPTKREGFGLVAAEANALSIPVVGYNIPGLRDAVISGKTGILVDYGNQEKLLEAIVQYYQFPHLKSLHGVQGRARVMKDFNPECIWATLYNEYEILTKL